MVFFLGKASLLTGFLLFALTTFAQDRKNDLIIKRDSVRIDCKIIRVNELTIGYKKVSDPDGPVFLTLKSEIARILFGNGEEESFSATVGLMNMGSSGVYSDTPWKVPGFMDNLPGRNSLELKHSLDFYKSKARERKVMAAAFGVVGGVAAIAGIILMNSVDAKSGYSYYGSDYEKRKGGELLLVAGLGTGILVGVIGGLTSRKYKSKALLVEKELAKRKVSQNQLKIRPSFDPYQRNVSVSLSLQF